MNKKIIKLLTLCLFCVLCFTACERYPLRALLGVHDQIDSWPDEWYIYDDEINTKGSLAPHEWEYNKGCDTWDKVKLDFAWKGSPSSGRNCIRFYWQGNTHDISRSFFGFGLWAREQEGGKVNLGKSGYTYLVFDIRGRLEDNCKFEISIPDATKASDGVFTSDNISTTWRTEVIEIKDDVKDVSYLLSMNLAVADYAVKEMTAGGEVYIDNVRLVKKV